MTLNPATIVRTWVQGATLSETLVATDADGNPIDLTGYAGRMEVRSLPKDDPDSSALVTATVTVTDAASGVFNYSISSAQSSSISSMTYAELWSDLELYTTADADVIKPFVIRWKMKAEYTA